MYYKHCIVKLCDECRMTMLRDEDITRNYLVEEFRSGENDTCEICGRMSVYASSILTDYKVIPEDDLSLIKMRDILENRTRRSLDEGFILLWIKDELEREEESQSIPALASEECNEPKEADDAEVSADSGSANENSETEDMGESILGEELPVSIG